jgi:hypothetical protein
MSDVNIVDAGMAKKGLTPFEASAPPPVPSASDLIGVPLESRVDRPIEGNSDEERVRESVRVLNEQREKDWQSGAISDDEFAAQREPVQEIGWTDKEQHTKREADTALSNYHRERQPDVQSFMAMTGATAEQALTLAKDPDWVQQQTGWTRAESEEYARSGRMPPMPIGVVDPKKGLRDRIADHENIYDRPRDEFFKNPKDATRQQSNFRDAVELSRQELARQEAEALQLLEQQPTGQVAPEQAAQSQQPSAAATEQPQPQADPVAQERAKLAAAQQCYEIAAAATEEEQKASAAIRYFQSVFAQKYPEAQNQAAIEETKQRNPARYNAMQADWQQAARGIDQWMRHGAAATQQRQAVENAFAQHQQALIRAAWHSYKDQQDAIAAKYIPELADATKTAPLRQATREMLRERGFRDDELAHVWDGHGGVSIRDGRVQAVIADAARWRMAQAAAKNRNAYKELPLVQRPGTARPRGAGDLETVQRLERDLANASGDKAVRIAAKLTAARRGL